MPSSLIASGSVDINRSEPHIAAITVRGLPEEVHRALKARARANGRSAEAEVRAILQEALFDADRVGIGSAIVAAFRGIEDGDEIADLIDSIREESRTDSREPPDFS